MAFHYIIFLGCRNCVGSVTQRGGSQRRHWLFRRARRAAARGRRAAARGARGLPSDAPERPCPPPGAGLAGKVQVWRQRFSQFGSSPDRCSQPPTLGSRHSASPARAAQPPWPLPEPAPLSACRRAEGPRAYHQLPDWLSWRTSTKWCASNPSHMHTHSHAFTLTQCMSSLACSRRRRRSRCQDLTPPPRPRRHSQVLDRFRHAPRVAEGSASSSLRPLPCAAPAAGRGAQPGPRPRPRPCRL